VTKDVTFDKRMMVNITFDKRMIPKQAITNNEYETSSDKIMTYTLHPTPTPYTLRPKLVCVAVISSGHLITHVVKEEDSEEYLPEEQRL
jgi:hypothetical protein